jgi:hypothetical protein
MNQKYSISETLNQCLDRLLKGESISQILADYPDQARELEPLLRIAIATQVFSKVQPRADFKARARYEFMSAARDFEAQSERRSIFKWRWQPAWAISLAAVVVVVLGGGATVAASNYSMPGEPLYSVKLATEQVRLALTVSDVTKTELNAEYANRRTEEIEYLATAGSSEQIQKTTARLNSSLANMSQLAQDDNPVKATGGNTTPNTMLSVASAPATLKAAPAVNAGISPSPVVLPATGFGVVSPTEVNVPQMAPVPVTIAGTGVDNSDKNDATAGSANSSSSVRSQSNTENASNTRKLIKKEKMRKIIEDNYQMRKARLDAALEKASPSLRPAVRQAIADSESEYWKSIQNLDQISNQNSNQYQNNSTNQR